MTEIVDMVDRVEPMTAGDSNGSQPEPFELCGHSVDVGLLKLNTEFLSAFEAEVRTDFFRFGERMADEERRSVAEIMRGLSFIAFWVCRDDPAITLEGVREEFELSHMLKLRPGLEKKLSDLME